MSNINDDLSNDIEWKQIVATSRYCVWQSGRSEVVSVKRGHAPRWWRIEHDHLFFSSLADIETRIEELQRLHRACARLMAEMEATYE